MPRHTMGGAASETEELLELALELPLEQTDDAETSRHSKQLIVYNDDFNTMEHVIKTLMRVCSHNRLQAEQCTYIIHFKGKCSVKRGGYRKLHPMCAGITDAGIKAEII